MPIETYMPLYAYDRAELINTLKEMVEIYQDEIRGGMPMRFKDQPDCIKRAMIILEKVSDYKRPQLTKG